jgi:hypothetical protein
LNNTLTTTNTTTGNLSLNGTTLSGSSTLTVANGRTLTMNLSSNTNYAGLISGNEYGITFEETVKNIYKVNFPNEFIQKYFSLPTSQVYDSQLGPYGDEHGDKDVPMNADKLYNTPSGPIAKESSIDTLLNNININTEGHPTNRIHFPSGIPVSLRGSGLGYIIYEAFIKYLGWGSSQPNASSLAQVIWSKLVEDPDFYSFVIEMNNDTSIFTNHDKK